MLPYNGSLKRAVVVFKLSKFMHRKYFGTDGVRGRVGQGVMTPEFVLKLGWAAGRVLCQQSHGLVLIGKDTRISGYMFESLLEAGLSAAGVHTRLLGPMPTPAIAYLTRTLRASAGIVISASHNPYHDNGVKFFNADGTKLDDDIELAIELEMQKPLETVESNQLGKVERVYDAAGRYSEFCKHSVAATFSLHGLSMVIDCAHGATYSIAPKIFTELGAQVKTIGSAPNGTNINHACGAAYPSAIRQAVVDQQADIGIAIDGDGDRLMMVDSQGEIIDGDQLLFIIAMARHNQSINMGGVVGTHMSNLGLEHALTQNNIQFQRAAVGDRYVFEMMQKLDWRLGGESSGHIICLDKTTTGDAIISALQVLESLQEMQMTLSQAAKLMTKYPQTLINVSIKETTDVLRSARVQAAVQATEEELAEQGRVLLRASGTEPLIRVMVEGADSHQVQAAAERLADIVQQECA